MKHTDKDPTEARQMGSAAEEPRVRHWFADEPLDEVGDDAPVGVDPSVADALAALAGLAVAQPLDQALCCTIEQALARALAHQGAAIETIAGGAAGECSACPAPANVACSAAGRAADKVADNAIGAAMPGLSLSVIRASVASKVRALGHRGRSGRLRLPAHRMLSSPMAWRRAAAGSGLLLLCVGASLVVHDGFSSEQRLVVSPASVTSPAPLPLLLVAQIVPARAGLPYGPQMPAASASPGPDVLAISSAPASETAQALERYVVAPFPIQTAAPTSSAAATAASATVRSSDVVADSVTVNSSASSAGDNAGSPASLANDSIREAIRQAVNVEHYDAKVGDRMFLVYVPTTAEASVVQPGAAMPMSGIAAARAQLVAAEGPTAGTYVLNAPRDQEVALRATANALTLQEAPHAGAGTASAPSSSLLHRNVRWLQVQSLEPYLRKMLANRGEVRVLDVSALSAKPATTSTAAAQATAEVLK